MHSSITTASSPWWVYQKVTTEGELLSGSAAVLLGVVPAALLAGLDPQALKGTANRQALRARLTNFFIF